MVYCDAFDPFDLDEQQFEQSDSDVDLGETDSGKKPVLGLDHIQSSLEVMRNMP